MKKAADALEESELTAEAITDKSGMTADAPVASEENVPSALVDGNETNYWESPDTAEATLDCRREITPRLWATHTT